jgi:hydrogenase small subunit
MTLDATKSGISRWDALAIAEIDILWMTAGLGCDGDTIVVTAPTQPSIADLVLRSSKYPPKPAKECQNISSFLKAGAFILAPLPQ